MSWDPRKSRMLNDLVFYGMPHYRKPRLRFGPRGYWELRPPVPVAPHYHECYVSTTPLGAYAMWRKEVLEAYDL
jgi:hypothetical protein